MRNHVATEKAHWLPPHPLEGLTHYALGNYGFDAINKRIAPKYLVRSRNLRRAWVRICTHLPETTLPDAQFEMLEFSTAHGAMLEIWRALGHQVRGTDYEISSGKGKTYTPMKPYMRGVFDEHHENPVAEDRPGWAYQPIIESLGLDVDLFDAGETPYAYADKSVDFICCYQALEVYADPEEWDRVIAEFCRIARRGVVIGFNPPGRRQEASADWPKTRKAWEKLRTYEAHGFRNVMFEMEQTAKGLHPSACKLLAV